MFSITRNIKKGSTAVSFLSWPSNPQGFNQRCSPCFSLSTGQGVPRRASLQGYSQHTFLGQWSNSQAKKEQFPSGKETRRIMMPKKVSDDSYGFMLESSSLTINNWWSQVRFGSLKKVSAHVSPGLSSTAENSAVLSPEDWGDNSWRQAQQRGEGQPVDPNRSKLGAWRVCQVPCPDRFYEISFSEFRSFFPHNGDTVQHRDAPCSTRQRELHVQSHLPCNQWKTLWFTRFSHESVCTSELVWADMKPNATI